ncbi:YrhC family protein [Lentibacillus sp. L22]|uniref:YrhC family protein n=1 Tax=Lentibacillus sp. L22 TaxID=3163028 RepID=UPI003465E7E8
MISRQKLKEKLKDYRRFSVTLLIIGIYFYLGGIMDTYMEPTADGGILTLLSLIMVICSGWFMFRSRKIKMMLENW